MSRASMSHTSLRPNSGRRCAKLVFSITMERGASVAFFKASHSGDATESKRGCWCFLIPAVPSSSARRLLSSIFFASVLDRVLVLSRMRCPWKIKSIVHTLLPLYRNSDMSLLNYELGVCVSLVDRCPTLLAGTRRFTNPSPALPQLFPNFLPVFSLALQARARITAELLAGTFDLENVPTFNISADANTTCLKVFPPQYVIENRSNAAGQIPVRRFNWRIAPCIDLGTEGVN